MSTEFSMVIGGDHDKGFTIKNFLGCRLVFGMVPVSEFKMLTHGFSKKAVMAGDLANRIGATFVIGEPADIEKLSTMEDLPVSASRQRDYEAALSRGLPEAVAKWLRTGSRGKSAEAICRRIFHLPAGVGIDHPYDPSDLYRCVQFLDVTDTRRSLSLMSEVSSEWSRLVDAWDQLESLLREEKQAGKQAPKTAALMEEILHPQVAAGN